MLPYTATDLVEILRRETDASSSSPRVQVTKTPGFFHQLRRRASSRLITPRERAV